MSRLRPRALHSTRLIVGLVAAGLVLVGCGGGSASSSSSTASPDASRSPNQDLRVAVGPDPFLQGNPPNLNMGLVSNGPNPGIFETLTNLTDQYGLQPGLAIRWESPSPQKWMFFLRPSVMFQNGEPFNAQAVVGTLETIAKRQTRPRGLDPGTSKVVANDEVEVDLTTPNGRLPEQLASPTMGIVAPGTVAGGGGSDPAMIPTGTGPFQFVSYQPGVNLMLKA
ncbi:MAG: ABC transporter substrate-binding protein, partial [Pseudonocardiaceae bacterium]